MPQDKSQKLMMDRNILKKAFGNTLNFSTTPIQTPYKLANNQTSTKDVVDSSNYTTFKKLQTHNRIFYQETKN
tara:strand:- start:5196 stop:5414 length:219 start_codon:yes stop_codon:yes gene_type:complete